MKAGQLWKELHFLFDTDDGSLPELHISNLSRNDVVAIFEFFLRSCHCLASDTTFWSIEEHAAKPIRSVPNAAALVTQELAEPFHVLCKGMTYNNEAISDLGLFVFDDEINLDYRMGQGWNAAKLEALFGMLREIIQLAPTAQINIEKFALPEIREQFQQTWDKYLLDI